jgi:hypothetical protein
MDSFDDRNYQRSGENHKIEFSYFINYILMYLI